jgi:hypothetical protein
MISRWVMVGDTGCRTDLIMSTWRSMAFRKRSVSVLLRIYLFAHTIYRLQPNICDSNLHAVDHANTRFSRGYRSTGAGAVVCGRHGLVRKNGLGDLQKGERCVIIFYLPSACLMLFADMRIWISLLCTRSSESSRGFYSPTTSSASGFGISGSGYSSSHSRCASPSLYSSSSNMLYPNFTSTDMATNANISSRSTSSSTVLEQMGKSLNDGGRTSIQLV